VNAAPTTQLRLLDLQALDAALDRLAHRRRSLPELAEVQRLTERAAELRTQLVLAETEEGDIAREQSKAEADVDQVRTRAARDQQRLDSGAVGSAKELESLQHEIETLGRRQSTLEDAVLEVMERREAVQGEVDAVRRELGNVEAELAEAERRRDEQLAQIAGEEAAAQAERALVAPEIDDALLALYDKIRAGSNGIGAAALLRGRCEGCHLQLTNADLGALRAAAEDEVVRCEECRRILVRTPESGL
jgi:predicted  nucleic acid-binding Zn-ribbon protein